MVSGGGEVVLIFGTVCSRIEFGDDGSFNLSVFCWRQVRYTPPLADHWSSFNLLRRGSLVLLRSVSPFPPFKLIFHLMAARYYSTRLFPISSNVPKNSSPFPAFPHLQRGVKICFSSISQFVKPIRVFAPSQFVWFIWQEGWGMCFVLENFCSKKRFLAVPRQLYRFPCHSLTHWLMTAIVEEHYHRALWETCDPWDM